MSLFDVDNFTADQYDNLCDQCGDMNFKDGDAILSVKEFEPSLITHYFCGDCARLVIQSEMDNLEDLMESLDG